MSSPNERHNSRNEGIMNNSLQYSYIQQQQQQAVDQTAQLSQYSSPWSYYNHMFGFWPRSYSDIAFMRTMMSIAASNPTLIATFQSAMQQIGLPHGPMPGSFWGTSSYPTLSNSFNANPSPTLSDLLSDSYSAATDTSIGIDANEIVGDMTRMASVDTSVPLPLDFTMESTLTAWSPEADVHRSATEEPQLTLSTTEELQLTNAKFADDREPVSSSQTDLLPEDKRSPQGNVPNPENKKPQEPEEEKFETPDCSEGDGVMTIDHLLFTCDMPNCKRKFKSFEYLRRHMLCHCKEQNFKCRFCNKAYPMKCHLVNHLKTHRFVKSSERRRNQKSYNCDFCEKKIQGKILLRLHIEGHMKKKEDHVVANTCSMTSNVDVEQFDFRPNFGCRIPGCGRFYPDIRQFIAHFKSQHNVDPSVRAKRSNGKKSTQGRGRPSKTQTEKDAEEKFPCPRCDKPFRRQDLLEKHLCWDH